MKRISFLAAKSLALVAMVMAISAITMSAQTPVKRVLIEEATGSWCGHCPRGAVMLVKTIEQYKGKVIGVAVHNGDAMTIPEEAAYSTAFIGGFPMMTVSRTKFGSAVGMSDQAIASPVAQELNKAAKVGVTLENVVFNPSTRIVTLDVKADFVSSVTGDIRFNLYIVEDSVKGTGSGYDQSNYMSKNSNVAPDPNSPWYNYPTVIPNFQHRHVLRAMLGGTWGHIRCDS
ncbi:MAG: Omp28-related outer membrane protein [Ignavibacteria bacterium]|nr:Omp28-related outer membrane protein [Ignavibacteria bacterium]